MAKTNQIRTKKEGLTVKDLIIMGVFGALLMVCSMIGGVLFAVTPTLLFYGCSIITGPRIFAASCKSAKTMGVNYYWSYCFFT